MRKAATTLILALAALVLTGCPQFKPWARTALEAARHACAAYAEQTGLSFKDVCDTEEKLRPFIDSILAAQAAAAAKGAAGACKCPKCEEAPKPAAPAPKPPPPTPSAKPEAKPIPKPEPAPGG